MPGSPGFPGFKDIQLFESIRYDSKAGFFLLGEHLERLRGSAAALGYACSVDVIQNELTQLSKPLRAGAYKVRIALEKNGRIETRAELLSSPEFRSTLPDTSETDRSQLPSVVISQERTSSRDAFLRHKTTQRALYDDEFRARAPRIYEVLFTNEKGHLTEGSRTNLFIQSEGRWKTPPVSDGLLAGVLRSHLLSARELENAPIDETSIRAEELARADRIVVCNSVRGVVEVRLG